MLSEYSPVSSGREEVDAAVHSAVRYSPLTVDVQLLSQVFLILLIDILHYWLPAAQQSNTHGLQNHTGATMGLFQDIISFI